MGVGGRRRAAPPHRALLCASRGLFEHDCVCLCVWVSVCLLPRHPRCPTPPAEEGDLYQASRCFRSFRVSHQPDVFTPPLPVPTPGLAPSIPAQEVGRPWGFTSLLWPHQPAATWAAGSLSRSRAPGGWLCTQQRRDPERVRRKPMSPPGDSALPLSPLGPQVPRGSLPALPPAWAGSEGHRTTFNSRPDAPGHCLPERPSPGPPSPPPA